MDAGLGHRSVHPDQTVHTGERSILVLMFDAFFRRHHRFFGALAFFALLLCIALLARDLGLWGLALGGGAAVAGWAFRILLVDRPRLARAEALWSAQGAASDVSRLLASAGAAQGELGYRLRLLRGRAHLALGDRDRAWLDGLQAQLARLPFWRRALVARVFRTVPEHPTDAHLRRAERLVKLAPCMGRLRHLLGILEFRRGGEDALKRAWARFAEALPLSMDDPLVLEDLMLAAFSQGLPEAGEAAFKALLYRHGDPRLPWDRAAAAFHLLQGGRHSEALALLDPLAPGQRTQPMHWLALAIAQRLLGQRDAAWNTVEDALQRHPDAFRLWMERYLIALERREEDEAYRSLEEAHRLLPPGPAGEAERQEWGLRRAEFAFWHGGDPERAWQELQNLPPEAQGSHHPPLSLQVRAAKGDYEGALEEVRGLLRNKPDDPPLLLLQADCLAGLETWETLLHYLDGLGEACRQYPRFWHLRGLGLAHLRDPIPARQDLERAARMDPNQIRFLMDAGHACAELGEWERAETHWRQSLNVDPRDEEALIHLAEARQELADLEGARRYLRECLLHHPDSADAQDRLAALEAH